MNPQDIDPITLALAAHNSSIRALVERVQQLEADNLVLARKVTEGFEAIGITLESLVNRNRPRL